MRRDERGTVQGPVKKQQPNGMSHGGASGLALGWRPAPCHHFRPLVGVDAVEVPVRAVVPHLNPGTSQRALLGVGVAGFSRSSSALQGPVVGRSGPCEQLTGLSLIHLHWDG